MSILDINNLIVTSDMFISDIWKCISDINNLILDLVVTVWNYFPWRNRAKSGNIVKFTQ